MVTAPKRRKVIIVGGGFGGLAAARALRHAPVDVTLVDRRNYHLFQPLLYQVATGELSPANIASPLRAIVRRQKNCRVLMADVSGFDLANRKVLCDGDVLEFDDLIVAAGARHSYFGKAEWESFAPGLKTLEDATEIRKRILWAFEAAERAHTDAEKHALLTFVIVGAGPTGVELAGALSEISKYTLRHDFRSINPGDAKIYLIEAGPKPLAFYPDTLTDSASQSLHRLGVTLLTHAKVTNIDSAGVDVERDGKTERIATHTILWAAGVQASPLGKQLCDASGSGMDRAGRVLVEPDLTLKNQPHVYVIGDLAAYVHEGGKPLPGLAPVAMQMGQYAAKRIRQIAQGQTPSSDPFKYHDRGSMAVIGRYSAVAQVGKSKWKGVIAWLLWLVIHLLLITQFRNRVLVTIQWGWTFFSRDRGARLITHVHPSELVMPLNPNLPEPVGSAR